MSDDENKIPESDPWANLESSAADEGGDGFAFAFEELEADAAAEPSPGETAPADVPLSVFPRPEADAESDDAAGAGPDPFEAALEADASPGEAAADAGRSGIIAISEVTASIAADGGEDAGRVADALADEVAALSGVLSGADMFDEQQLARELAAEDGEHPDFGDHSSESISDDVSFHAGTATAGAASADAGDPFAGIGDPMAEEAMTLPIAAGVVGAAAAASAAAAPTKAAATAKKPAPAKKQGGGVAQIIGIVLGGLLAIPLAFAILIWGFQKDPFKFARQAPPQLAFLFPEKLRAAPERAAGKPAGRAKTAAAGPDLSQSRSLDDIPGLDGGAAAPAGAESQPDGVAAATPTATIDTAAAAAVPQPDADTAAVAAKTEMKPGDEPAAIPVPDPLAALDAPGAAPAGAPAPPPLDLSGVQAAAAGAADALDALSAADPAEPSRRKLLVGWYRQLARLGTEMALLENVAAASGRPLEAAPEEAVGVLDRVRGDEAAIAELDRLATMWITSQKRQSDGVVLVAAVDAVRQVGPYWSTRLSVVGAGPDGADRTLTAISRVQPAADAGDRVIVTGVMFDGDAVWAVDVRPVGAAPAVNLAE